MTVPRNWSSYFLCIAAGVVGGMNLYSVFHHPRNTSVMEAVLSAFLSVAMFAFALFAGKRGTEKKGI